jgi:hypothetical protein
MSKHKMPSFPILSCADWPRADKGCFRVAVEPVPRALRAVRLPLEAAVPPAAVPLNFLSSERPDVGIAVAVEI